MNLLFAINRKFIPLFGSCIRSIVKNGGYEHYDIYIVQSDFDEAAKEEVKRLAGEKVSCHYVDFDSSIFEGFPVTGRYPQQIYYRLAAPLLLPEDLDRILYLDVDLLVINPLKDLYETDFEGNYYAACTHTKEILTKINQVRLGASEDAVYANTGVLLMNLTELRKVTSIDKIRDYANEKIHSLILPDQDILTALYGEYVKVLDTMKYNLSDRILLSRNSNPKNPTRNLDWVRQNTVIVHYCGKNKPWNDNYHGVLGVFWNENEER